MNSQTSKLYHPQEILACEIPTGKVSVTKVSRVSYVILMTDYLRPRMSKHTWASAYSDAVIYFDSYLRQLKKDER